LGFVAAAALFVASGAAAEENTVKIGVNAALTGSFVSAGNTIHNAVKLAVKQINDAGGFVVNGKDLQARARLSRRSYRREHGDRECARACRGHRRQGDLGHREPRFLDRHDQDHQSAKVLQFTGNSSLGCCLSADSTKPGGDLHYTFQTEPQEFQRSGSTAKGVITLLTGALGPQAKQLDRLCPG